MGIHRKVSKLADSALSNYDRPLYLSLRFTACPVSCVNPNTRIMAELVAHITVSAFDHVGGSLHNIAFQTLQFSVIKYTSLGEKWAWGRGYKYIHAVHIVGRILMHGNSRRRIMHIRFFM